MPISGKKQAQARLARLGFSCLSFLSFTSTWLGSSPPSSHSHSPHTPLLHFSLHYLFLRTHIAPWHSQLARTGSRSHCAHSATSVTSSFHLPPHTCTHPQQPSLPLPSPHSYPYPCPCLPLPLHRPYYCHLSTSFITSVTASGQVLLLYPTLTPSILPPSFLPYCTSLTPLSITTSMSVRGEPAR